MTLEEIGEIKLIEEISKIIQKEDKRVLVPVGDDAAVCVSPRHNTVLTTDILVEEVHFKLDSILPYQLGYKALAVNLSDIAAMAGLPRFALVSLGLKPKTELKWIQEFYRGMMALGANYDVTVVGGDVSRAALVSVTATIVGEVEPELLRRRNEAKVGHRILVTGKLGAAAAGLLLLDSGIENPDSELIQAHFFPNPRITEARIASQEGASAMEDISDGLAREISNIAKASKVGARIYAQKIPVAPGVKKVAKDQNKHFLELALAGGEDYELVFTVAPQKVGQVASSIVKKTKTLVTEVGEIVPKESGVLLGNDDFRDFPLDKLGYNHFKMNNFLR